MLFWAVLLAAYLLAVRALRYRRMHSTAHRYRHLTTSPEALGHMTLQEAFDIQLDLAELEFPTTFSVSIFFALFKTYGIPSISELLSRTGELAGQTTASKRAADTGVLLTEFVLNRPGTDRNLDAIARMNWLHDLYRKSGKIQDDDMLYTLSLFALEPMRWSKKLEWRDLNDLERCAMALYWKNMGDVMNISSDRLPSSTTGWTNALEWLKELEAWSNDYEAENMVPNPTNRVLADATIGIGLTNVPQCLRPLGTQFASALLSHRLRRAMIYPEPPSWVQATLDLGILLRRRILRHLCPPRPQFMRPRWFSKIDAETGKYHAEQYIGLPWYVEPSFRRRWHLNSWLLWLTGGHIPSTSTPEYRPEGYKIQELGPVQLEGKGLEEMEVAKDVIAKLQGCPFHVKK